jgi:hypothetical protein
VRRRTGERLVSRLVACLSTGEMVSAPEEPAQGEIAEAGQKTPRQFGGVEDRMASCSTEQETREAGAWRMTLCSGMVTAQPAMRMSRQPDLLRTENTHVQSWNDSWKKSGNGQSDLFPSSAMEPGVDAILTRRSRSTRAGVDGGGRTRRRNCCGEDR